MVFSFFLKNDPLATPSPDKTVLIIGGGMAGLSAIYGLRQLDQEVKIVLICPKDYSEILWASYRSPFDETIAKGSLIRLEPYCREYNVELIQGIVTHLSKKNEATYSPLASTDTKTISFDACVVATGATSLWEGMGRSLPTSPEQATPQFRLEEMAAEGKRLLAAKSVVIVGGGLIGTELAGDLAAAAQKKGNSPSVTLVHSGDQLCPIMSPPAAVKMKQLLEDLGVTIILSEKATEVNGKIILQNSKKEIEADVVIKTIGFQSVNESFLKQNYAEALDENGWIKIDEYLGIPGSNGNVFAFGDCSHSLPDAANVYMRTAGLLGNNIKASLLEKKELLQKYEIPFAGYCNTAGPNAGVFYSSAFWTTWFLPWMKNKTMFFMSPKDMIGVKPEYSMAD